MAKTTYKLVYTAYGESVITPEMTEAQASKYLRNLISNFYDREMGCTNGLVSHYGEIYVERNCRTILQYTGGDFYRVRKGEFSKILNWDVIFTSYVSEVA